MNCKSSFKAIFVKVLEAGERLKLPTIAKALHVLLAFYLGWLLRESRLLPLYVLTVTISWYWLVQAQLETIKPVIPPARKTVWKLTYTIIKPKMEQNEYIKVISAFLQTNYPDLPHDEKTLRKIWRAGEKGLLD